MSYFSRYDKGEWSVLCDVCGRKFRNQDLRQRWDGLKTCSDDWEPRQPQDFVRGVADYQAPVWTRPEPADQFRTVTIIYDDYGNPLMPAVAQEATVTIGVHKFRFVPTLSCTSTSAVSITKAVTLGSKVVNGFVLNSRTLG